MSRTQARQAFGIFSLHAKLHQKLRILTRKEQLLQSIEREQIYAYDNTDAYTQLLQLKKELLQIHFIDEQVENPSLEQK